MPKPERDRFLARQVVVEPAANGYSDLRRNYSTALGRAHGDGWAGAPHHLRKRGEPACCALGGLATGDGRADLSRSVAVASRPATARRERRSGIREADWSITVEGSPANNRNTGAYINALSPGYWRTMGVPLLDGRDFNARDVDGAPKVGIVNRSFALAINPPEATRKILACFGLPTRAPPIAPAVPDGEAAASW